MSKPEKLSDLPACIHAGTVTVERVWAFAQASRDFNPVHLSASMARQAGFDGPIVHGMFIAARFETFLQRLSGIRLRKLEVRFVQPMAVGESLVIVGRHLPSAEGELRIRLLAKSTRGSLLAVGEATASG